MFVVYSNEEAKWSDCFSFLKSGFDDNEFLFIMMYSLSKGEIFKRSAKEWNFVNMKDLEEIKDDIIITTPKEWHYPDGDFDTYRIPEKMGSDFFKCLKKG